MSDFVQDGTDRIYDIWNANKQTQRYKNEMLRYNILKNLLAADEIKSIIDVGCGTGYLDMLLAAKGMKVTAFDLSEKRLSLFRAIAQRNGITQVRGDLFEKEFAGFDAVVCQEVLEHLPDYEKALARMNTFIKPSGLGLFCVPYRENLEAKIKINPETGERYHTSGHLHSFTEEKLATSVEKAGFEIMHVKTLVNKRTFKWFSRLKIPVNNATLIIDSIFSMIRQDKAAYIAVLCRKKI